MGKNEIRLRRSRLSGKGSERFRNYGAVVEQHEKQMRLKKILRVFMLFLVILILVALFFFINQIEQKAIQKESYHSKSFFLHNT